MANPKEKTYKLREIEAANSLASSLGERIRIGLIALSTDVAIEHELHRLLPDETISVSTTRIKLEVPNSHASFAKLESGLHGITDYLIPSSRLDAVVFGCTSGSAIIGHKKVEQIIRSHLPDVKVVTPIDAVGNALKHLNVARLGVIAPYTASLTETVIAYIENYGVEVIDAACFGLNRDEDIGRVPPDLIREQVKRMSSENVDAIFVTCTALEIVSIIEELEQLAGMPILTSNQAVFWHTLKQCEWTHDIVGFGHLLRRLD